MASAAAAMAAVLLLALVYWAWFGLFRRVINHDDGISLLVVQGILEHGAQILPSGYSYGRGFLHHHVLAASSRVFGWNTFAILLPSLLMGLGTLVLLYRIAADILRRPWLGVAAALLLVTLTVQTWYATGPRMYISLQFFTMLATYAFWRGFIEGSPQYRVLAFAALLLGTLSNQAGAIVALALPLAAVPVLRLRGQSWREVFSPTNVVVVAALGTLTYLIASYQPENAAPLVMGHGGLDPDRLGINLSPVDWGRHVLQLERSIPYGLGFLLITYLAFFGSARRGADPEQRWSYLVISFTLFFLVYGSLIKSGGHRHVLFLLPLYALIVCAGAVAITGLFSTQTSPEPHLQRRNLFASLALLCAGIGVGVGLSTLKQLDFRDVRSGRESLAAFALRTFRLGPSFTGLVKDAYGLPCGYDYRCERTMADEFEALRARVGPQDLVISGLPMETSYYLGRMDGWLFFPVEGNSYPTLDRSPTDEYFGRQIIDTVAEYRQLATRRRVWVITPAPYESTLLGLEDPLWAEITSRSKLERRGPNLLVYLSTPG